MITIDARFKTFLFPGLLRSGEKLILNTQQFYGLSILTLSNDQAPLIVQCLLTENERLLFLQFADCYPSPAPYENLLAILSDEDVTIMRERFYASQETINYGSTMQPLRHAISRLRNKLLLVGILIHVKSFSGYELKTAW